MHKRRCDRPPARLISYCWLSSRPMSRILVWKLSRIRISRQCSSSKAPPRSNLISKALDNTKITQWICRSTCRWGSRWRALLAMSSSRSWRRLFRYFTGRRRMVGNRNLAESTKAVTTPPNLTIRKMLAWMWASPPATNRNCPWECWAGSSELSRAAPKSWKRTRILTIMRLLVILSRTTTTWSIQRCLAQPSAWRKLLKWEEQPNKIWRLLQIGTSHISPPRATKPTLCGDKEGTWVRKLVVVWRSIIKIW